MKIPNKLKKNSIYMSIGTYNYNDEIHFYGNETARHEPEVFYLDWPWHGI